MARQDTAHKLGRSITEEDLREISRKPRGRVETFAPYKPIAGVVPDNVPLAMDSAYPPQMATALNNMIADGVAFMGYPRLAEMAQRVEYRHIVEVLAEEATREWIEITAVGDEDKAERIKDLKAEFERLKVRDTFKRLSVLDGFYGTAQLYIDTGLDRASSDLANPLLLEPETFPKGSLKAITPIEAVWISPHEYNSSDPLKQDFYRPRRWWVMGATVHTSRLLRFVAREVTQILSPSYNFGGVPLIQLAKPYVDNWVRTRQSVSDLINGCSIVSLKADMNAVVEKTGIGGLINRIEQFIRFRDNRGVFLTNKDTEELDILSANLSGLDKLQAQALEQICVVAQMPLVKLTGVSPSGLNASSEGEIRVWYDRVAAYQESFFRPGLTHVMHAAMLNLWGEIDEGITFDFVPLWQLDEAAKATIAKTRADTDAVYVEIGAISQDEVRQKIAADPDSGYAGVDLSGPGYEPLAEQEGGESAAAGVETFGNAAAHVHDDGV